MTNLLDTVVGWFSPGRALRRTKLRAAAKSIELAYEGARVGRRTSGWLTNANSANAEIGTDLALLRERSRELIRNNHYAAKGALEFQTKTIGAGILARVQQQPAQKLWERWGPRCSADGLAHFEAVESLVARTVFESGECLVRFRPRRAEDGLPVALQLQILEPDFLDTNKTVTTATGYIIHGVEFDLTGKRVAYWLFPQHPGEVISSTRRPSIQSARIPAEDVLHIYESCGGRPGQVRGVPHLAPVMLAMRDLDDWETAELLRKKTEACLAAFVSSPDSGETITPTTTDADGNAIETFRPGMIAYGSPGSKVDINTPNYAGGYEDYKRSRIRDLAAGIGMPYEILRGDLSQVNYSSYRAGLLGFRDRIEAFQWNVIIPLLCQPVWRRFIDTAVLGGQLPPGDYRAEWAPPAFDLLDRAAEAKADSDMLASGTMTWPQAVSRQGYDPERQIQDIEKWKPRLDAAGIVFGKDGGANAATQQQNPQ